MDPKSYTKRLLQPWERILFICLVLFLIIPSFIASILFFHEGHYTFSFVQFIITTFITLLGFRTIRNILITGRASGRFTLRGKQLPFF